MGGGEEGKGRLAVRVPLPLRAAFEEAQRYVERYFSERVEDPVRGIIEIAGDRYILVRAASMSTEFFELVAGLYRDRGEEEARHVATSFLYDVAHALGKADAHVFHERMGVSDPIEKLSAGPIHFAFSGWALVDIREESRPTPDDDYFLCYDHPYSFEADSWVRSGKKTDAPVCTMNAGYSSGWCEESFGLPLVSVEISCRAAGDEHCRFIMAPPHRIQERLAQHAPDIIARGEGATLSVPEFFQRKRLEEELQQHHDHLEEMVAARTVALTEANAKLRREMEERQRVEKQLAHVVKMEAIGQLAGGLAHDFNNLLTTILAGVQMAQRHSEGNDKAGEWLQHALAATERAADLTRHMLVLSSEHDPQKVPVDISEVVRSTASFLRSSIPKDIEVVVEKTAPDTIVLADTSQIEHALINLAINGRDAMPDGGKLSFDVNVVEIGEDEAALDPATWAGPFVCVSVTDTGVGIAPEFIDRIFEPMFTTKSHGAGTGFGLPRVYACARAHSGWVTVDSEIAVGTRFCLYLPAAEAPSSVAPSEPIALPTGHETVLIVDDTEAILYAGQSILEACGYSVVVARDGREAIEVYERPDANVAVVLTDLVMPDMDGRALLHGLRDRGYDGPVVLMSGHAIQRSTEQLVSDGFADFVPKPFDAKKLAVALRRALDA